MVGLWWKTLKTGGEGRGGGGWGPLFKMRRQDTKIAYEQVHFPWRGDVQVSLLTGWVPGCLVLSETLRLPTLERNQCLSRQKSSFVTANMLFLFCSDNTERRKQRRKLSSYARWMSAIILSLAINFINNRVYIWSQFWAPHVMLPDFFGFA